MNYDKELCYGCGRVFAEGDDIVVCPECGTPQHRECWEKERKCVNAHLHAEGFEWKPKHSETKEKENKLNVKTSNEVIVCPFCGHENPSDAVQCENCSQPFQLFGKNILGTEQSQKSDRKDSENGYSYKPPFTIDGEEPGGEYYEQASQSNNTRKEHEPFIFNGEPLDGEVSGTETKDFVSYIRASVPSYYRKFKKADGGKHTFNFGAFFFGAYWYFFRKLYKPGIIFLSITFCITIAFRNPITESAEKYMNVVQKINELRSVEEGEAIDDDYVTEVLTEATEVTEEIMPALLGFTGCQLLVNLAAAFFADRLYRKKYLADMEFISQAKFIGDPGLSEEQARFITINKMGGLSLFAPAIAYVALDILSRILEAVFFT